MWSASKRTNHCALCCTHVVLLWIQKPNYQFINVLIRRLCYNQSLHVMYIHITMGHAWGCECGGFARSISLSVKSAVSCVLILCELQQSIKKSSSNICLFVIITANDTDNAYNTLFSRRLYVPAENKYIHPVYKQHDLLSVIRVYFPDVAPNDALMIKETTTWKQVNHIVLLFTLCDLNIYSHSCFICKKTLNTNPT